MAVDKAIDCDIFINNLFQLTLGELQQKKYIAPVQSKLTTPESLAWGAMWESKLRQAINTEFKDLVSVF